MPPIVLVTGCSQGGIGEYLCFEFLKQKCTVYATARKLETLQNLAQKGAQTLILDITNQESINTAVEHVIKESGRIDVLVNNAGYGLYGPVSEIDPEDIRKLFETNVYGQIAMCQAVIPHMQKQKSGKIANVGSVSGIISTPFAGAYCASKAALHSLSDALRVELEPFNIQIVVIAPGAIKTNFTSNAKTSAQDVLKKNSPYIPIKSFIEKRMQMSQIDSTDPRDFAKHTVSSILKKKNAAYYFYGKNSFLGPFIRKWLPFWLLDLILGRLAGIHLLKSKSQKND